MRRARLVFFASLFVGCSLLGNYDLEGQPCDKAEPNPALSCLSDAGYTCVSGLCKKGVAPGIDAGIDAGFKDAGADGGADGGSDGGNLGG